MAFLLFQMLMLKRYKETMRMMKACQRQFKKILKQVDRRSNGQNIRFNIDKQQGNSNNARTNKKSNQSKESNDMNVKDMVTSELNVPHFSRDKRKVWMSLGLIKMTQKEKRRVNMLSMSLL